MGDSTRMIAIVISERIVPLIEFFSFFLERRGKRYKYVTRFDMKTGSLIESKLVGRDSLERTWNKMRKMMEIINLGNETLKHRKTFIVATFIKIAIPRVSLLSRYIVLYRVCRLLHPIGTRK